MQRFYLPVEIITGRGCIDQLGSVAAASVPDGDASVMVVTGRRSAQSSGLLDRAVLLLEQAGLTTVVFAAARGEADLATVEEGILLARREGCGVFVGLGGGSAIDTAKAIAGMVRLPGSVWEYHEGRSLEDVAAPLMTVPTTAGTGAEVTKNAVLINPHTSIKKSIRDDSWFARTALVDPELACSMPANVTASTGSDALCQAIESYTSIAATPVTDGLAMQAISLIGANLPKVYRNGDDLDAREAMSMGSLMAGMAMASARLGGVHGMAHPLGSHYGIPHGVVCGLLLPHTMAHNLGWAMAKYATVSRLLGLPTQELPTEKAAEQAVVRVRELMVEIDIPQHLSDYGVAAQKLDTIIKESLPSGSLRHNPRPLDADDVRSILKAAL